MGVGVRVLNVVTMGLLVLAGCGQSPVQPQNAAVADEPRAAALRTGQIIIKFRDPRTDPSRADVLRSLSQAAGAELEYVRPMSGGAHVFRIRGEADVPQAVERLNQSPQIEYAEPDRLMRHQ